MTFRKQAVAPAEANLPDWAKPEVKEADRKSERAVESEFEYTPTEPMTELVESGIFKNFKKKAEPPEREWELVDQTRGYVPIKLPSRILTVKSLGDGEVGDLPFFVQGAF